jgi:hypothetical protein
MADDTRSTSPDAAIVSACKKCFDANRGACNYFVQAVAREQQIADFPSGTAQLNL